MSLYYATIRSRRYELITKLLDHDVYVDESEFE